MLETSLLVGTAFGVRHAFEADHVAAVATLVEDEGGSASTGAAWGMGHSIPILVLGALFLASDLRLPDAVAGGFEALVAVVLVVLGVRVLAGREALGTSLVRHVHGGGEDGGDGGHRHLTVAGREIGLAHSHADEESFAVGVVHGLAGSGGVVVVLASAAPTVSTGVGFLVGFAVATVASMGVAAWGWGRVVGHADILRAAAGVASVAVGVLLFAETVGVAAPF